LIRPGATPGLLQDVLVVELEPVQIELDRTPGVRLAQVGEVIHQVGLGQIVDLMIEVISDPADGARIRLDRLRLQTPELQVLLVQLVVLVEDRSYDSGHVFHLAVTSHS
jgi:hypothetical protein